MVAETAEPEFCGEKGSVDVCGEDAVPGGGIHVGDSALGEDA